MDKVAQVSRGTDGDDTRQGGDTMDDIQLGGKGNDKLYGNSGRSDRPVHPKDESGISGISPVGEMDISHTLSKMENHLVIVSTAAEKKKVS